PSHCHPHSVDAYAPFGGAAKLVDWRRRRPRLRSRIHFLRDLRVPHHRHVLAALGEPQPNRDGRLLRAPPRPHRAFAARVGPGAWRTASPWGAELRHPPTEPVPGGSHLGGSRTAPELVRRTHELVAGRLGRTVVAVDRRDVLPCIPHHRAADASSLG